MRLIVGITGASGVIMGDRLLQPLRAETDTEVHLVVTEAAEQTWALETELPISALYDLADVVYEPKNLAAAISSGSYVTDGMIVMPCSMKTLAGIVNGFSENLLLRACDVCLKEGRRLVLVPREMPLGRVHLRNLLAASELGCAVVPPMLTFYNHPLTVYEQIDHVIGKVLLQFGIIPRNFRAWEA
jgi:4-hydroxy-3-polyprenylbenzoate decarboxylase